jgi:hypothetical protein
VNEEALAHWGLLCQIKKKIESKTLGVAQSEELK